MACNCAAQEQIEKLIKEYGVKNGDGDNMTLSDYIKNYGHKTLMFFLMIVTYPFLFIYVLALLFWRETPVIKVSDINLLTKFKFLR